MGEAVAAADHCPACRVLRASAGWSPRHAALNFARVVGDA